MVETEPRDFFFVGVKLKEKDTADPATDSPSNVKKKLETKCTEQNTKNNFFKKKK